MQSMIENYINGNIRDARKQAKRYSGLRIAQFLAEEWGFSENKSRLVAQFLKTGEGWQAACDAK